MDSGIFLLSPPDFVYWITLKLMASRLQNFLYKPCKNDSPKHNVNLGFAFLGPSNFFLQQVQNYLCKTTGF